MSDRGSELEAEIVLASRNPGKLVEIRALLGALPVRLLGLDGFPEAILPEEGDAYEANALAKARSAARATNRWALADDSGLEVDALQGAPGPRSARFGGPGLDDAGRSRALLDALAGVPAARRMARFVCVAALVTPHGGAWCFRGECRGRILEAPRGEAGFGYDPVFAPEGSSRSMAELSAEEKNRISHRAHAFRALARALEREIRADSGARARPRTPAGDRGPRH